MSARLAGRGVWAAAAQQYSLVAVLVVVIAIFTFLSSSFLTPSNVANILLQSAATAIAAVGMTFVILTGGIDLSIGSGMNLALVAALFASGARSATQGDTNAWVYPVALVVGTALGLLNGLIINRFKVHPIIATLGTLSLYRGIALHLTSAGDFRADGAVRLFARAQVLSLGWPVIVAVLVVVVASFVLRQTVVGRQILAVGGSLRSAQETGLPIERIRPLVFAVAGLCAAIAGLVIVGRVGVLQSNLGFNFEFTVITAVVLGGTSLFGGRGTVVGSVLGAVLLTTIDNGLNLINASIFIYDVIRGVVLILAVTIDSSLYRLGRRSPSLVPTGAG